MKLSLNWLREFVDVDLPVAELARQLIDATAEVESWETIGAEWDPEKIRVARGARGRATPERRPAAAGDGRGRHRRGSRWSAAHRTSPCGRRSRSRPRARRCSMATPGKPTVLKLRADPRRRIGRDGAEREGARAQRRARGHPRAAGRRARWAAARRRARRRRLRHLDLGEPRRPAGRAWLRRARSRRSPGRRFASPSARYSGVRQKGIEDLVIGDDRSA